MLTRLIISNFVLIDKLDLDFKSGLTALTGETGSGKSIIIDALMLIFGARATPDIIRQGADSTDLVAEFSLVNQDAIAWLIENDLHDPDDTKNLICRRVIDSAGKNKIYINGHVVTATQARILNEFILDIHTQHAAITLLKQDSQRKLVDEYAGISPAILGLKNLYKKILLLKSTIIEATTNSEKIVSLKENLQNELQDLLSLNLKAGEWPQLETRHKEVTNLGAVLHELDIIQNVINQDDASLLRGINVISTSINKITEYVPRAEDLAKIVESIDIEIAELNQGINSLAKTINLEPQELEQLEDRIKNVFDLSRKHKINPEQIEERIKNIEEELGLLNESANLDNLKQELTDLEKEYSNKAHVATKARNEAAITIAKKVTELLHKLAIKGEFKVNLVPQLELTAFGLENIEFNVSFNQGLPAQPLAKVASGGELSRTALSLYLLLSMKNAPETIIFDEIDVGIGGAIASYIGKMLNQLGTNKQVICITHQAQTAGFANNHLVVSKKNTAGYEITQLSANYLNDQERVKEIARMIGGVEITATTIKHAEEILAVKNI